MKEMLIKINKRGCWAYQFKMSQLSRTTLGSTFVQKKKKKKKKKSSLLVWIKNNQGKFI